MAKPQNRKLPRKSALRLNVEAMITAFIFAMIIRTFVICPFKIPSSSMHPTLFGDPKLGDRILVNRYCYFFSDPKRGDIMVFKTRGIDGLDQNKDYIKRLVGLPGDKLYIKNDRVYINDKLVEDNDLVRDKRYSYNSRTMKYGSPDNPVIVPEGNFFVMGDNTDNSKDSRYFGFVPESNLAGRAFMIYWPYKRFMMLH